MTTTTKKAKTKIACPFCRLHGETLFNSKPTRFQATVTLYDGRGKALRRATGRLCTECKALAVDWPAAGIAAERAEEHRDDLLREAQQLEERAEAAYQRLEKARAKGADDPDFWEAREAWQDAQEDAEAAEADHDRAEAEADRLNARLNDFRRAPPDGHDDDLSIAVRGPGGKDL